MNPVRADTGFPARAADRSGTATGLDRQFLLPESIAQVVAVLDAGAISDDQRWPIIGLRFGEHP